MGASGVPMRYARGFSGIVDLISALPTCLSLLVPAAHDLLGIRLLPGIGVLKGTHHPWHGLP